MNDKCIEVLQQLTGKGHVLFTQRGNFAIRLALKLVKNLGYARVLLQDQGGWITYKQFCEKEKLEIVELKTDYGLVEPDDLKDYSDCVLLINSMPGYVALQDMKPIAEICQAHHIFIINDISGSIDTDEAKFGDIILGSFAHDKPVNIDGHGGFMAIDNDDDFAFLEKNNPAAELDFASLIGRLYNLSKRLSVLQTFRDRLIREVEEAGLADNILHREHNGINLIVKYSSADEKEKLINLAEKERLEFTLCPRDIRVNIEAVCFEIKRR